MNFNTFWKLMTQCGDGDLGERIALHGWNRYKGGLDVKGDMTGPNRNNQNKDN